MAEQASEKHTPTTEEERTQRRVFWATILIHDPPLLAGFEHRLLHDYEALRQQNERLLGALRALVPIAETWTDRLDVCPDDGQIWSGHHLAYTGGQLREARAVVQEAEGQ